MGHLDLHDFEGLDILIDLDELLFVVDSLLVYLFIESLVVLLQLVVGLSELHDLLVPLVQLLFIDVLGEVLVIDLCLVLYLLQRDVLLLGTLLGEVELFLLERLGNFAQGQWLLAAHVHGPREGLLILDGFE